jgi:nanoRNase/pAp phosphatase (c-di-AMP/oligoRNAs hydrolase)
LRSVDDKIAKLLELLEEESKCLILTHDNPDPDSISSAVALRHFLKSEKKI